MALVVEDGTGLANAEAYESDANLLAYASARGTDLSGLPQPEREAALRLGAQWIDTRCRYKAARLRAEQRLEFPRTGLVDWSGYTVVGVPSRIKDANCELAMRVLDGTTLAADQTRDAYVRSEAVGPISVTYRDDAPAVAIFTLVERMLEQYVRNPADHAGPFFGGGTTGAFGFGMHGNRG